MPRGVAKNQCGHPKRRSGAPCEKPAGWGTDHKGEGWCKIHGGNAAIKTGIYSKQFNYSGGQFRERFKRICERHENNPDPLDLRPELAVTRALLEDWLERHEHWLSVLERWHEWDSGQFRAELQAVRDAARARDVRALKAALVRFDRAMEQAPPRPKQIMDPIAVTRVIDTAAKVVDKITAVRDRQQVSYGAVIDLQQKMAMVVLSELRRVLDKDRAEKAARRIADQWGEIQLEV